jgi:hypothetical protein
MSDDESDEDEEVEAVGVDDREGIDEEEVDEGFNRGFGPAGL